MDHEHQWEPWQTTADQLGALYPDENGVYWHYERYCNVMGCECVEYAENIMATGQTKIIDKAS